MTIRLAMIDTHTHFDVPEFDQDRAWQAGLAYQAGVNELVLIGYLARHFPRMLACQNALLNLIKLGQPSPRAHLAFGLHPLYIREHTEDDLQTLAQYLDTHPSVAIGEIGLDTYDKALASADWLKKQASFFEAQLGLASTHKLPVLLHIRKAHAETLGILKAQKFSQGGIAHSFSGGIQEAKAFVNLGFKIGITGQITNPNAKKLHTTISTLVSSVGIDSLVIETDCPDFTPLPCHQTHGRRNVPANLIFVLEALSQLLKLDKALLAKTLYTNSEQAIPKLISQPNAI